MFRMTKCLFYAMFKNILKRIKNKTKKRMVKSGNKKIVFGKVLDVL